jgi:hypothetical protein
LPSLLFSVDERDRGACFISRIIDVYYVSSDIYGSAFDMLPRRATRLFTRHSAPSTRQQPLISAIASRYAELLFSARHAQPAFSCAARLLACSPMFARFYAAQILFFGDAHATRLLPLSLSSVARQRCHA